MRRGQRTGDEWLTDAAAWPAGVRWRATGRVEAKRPFDLSLTVSPGTDGDALAQAARHNRADLALACGLDGISWMRQVHGTRVLSLDDQGASPGEGAEPEADGLVTRRRRWGIAVLTADCLPVVLARTDASAVAVVHAGWRGLHAGIIARGIEALGADGGAIVGLIGPGIGPCHYEVDTPLIDAFRDYPQALAGTDERARLDLAAVARAQMTSAGVHCCGVGPCTWCAAGDYFSYRREGVTGRQAMVAWLE